MTKLWAFIRHNQGMFIGGMMALMVLIWAYGCQSQVASIVNPTVLITRDHLVIEVEAFLAQQQAKVDTFIAQAELKFTDLDKQDQIKNTIFETALTFMEGGNVNPAGVAIVLAGILGLGAGVDNVRKRTLIQTLKKNAT